MQYIKSLTELSQADLPAAGGKGANLGALIQAGLPVQPGYCIITRAYQAFVQANALEPRIRRILEAAQMNDIAALEDASAAIRACFQQGALPPALADEIRLAYAGLGGAVAVRSSATAEDLPDLSFAGQQDTYLNVVGEAALLDAVARCWASLWTARAIGYRARNQIAQDDVALAVVVQRMVQSEASGVLFTANPLTGRRGETVIDATLGLGEALVSGQVEPDHYVVGGSGDVILEKTIGAKALAIQGRAGGGTVTLQQSADGRQALPDEQILELARLGRQAQAYFGGPQDMEWAWAGGQLAIVQSRPVTSLYPLPAGLDERRFEALLSFGVWQGMLDPYTPLGQDMFSILVSGMGKVFGQKISASQQRAIFSAGERLFVNLTGLLSDTLGRNFVALFLGSIDPASGAIIAGLLADPRLKPVKSAGLKGRLQLIRGVGPLIGNVLRNLLWPARGRARLDWHIETGLAALQKECDVARSLADLAAVIESAAGHMPEEMLPRLVAGIAAGQAPYQILIRRAGGLAGAQELLMDLARGLPHNVTTQMDLALWRAAQAIRADSVAAACFSTAKVDTLAAAYQTGSLPPAAQAAVGEFISVYGMRGVGEIDLGRPRWRENPAGLMQAVKSYLQMDQAASPETAFERGVERARQAQARLEQALAQAPAGARLPRPIVRMMIGRFRELGGLRETPKFFVVRMLSIYREALLAAGKKLAAAGQLERADDLFYLHITELKELGSGKLPGVQRLVAARRAVYEREMRRKRIPRILLSDGSAFYDAPEAPSGDGAVTFTGSPVSTGTVEGAVRVVLDPHGAQLAPGEILVCPATDPAWTPLFLAAGGLVMEVGGMMTHGSVVAREYGIPAVAGVSQATTRLRTGQRVRVDGLNGRVTVLEN